MFGAMYKVGPKGMGLLLGGLGRRCVVWEGWEWSELVGQCSHRGRSRGSEALCFHTSCNNCG